MTVHALRHTFASRLVMAGVERPSVKELLGHKDIRMSMRYTHLSCDDTQAAKRKLECFGEKVSAIFITAPANLPRKPTHVLKPMHAPVAQPG